MEQSEDIKELAAALVAAQNAMGAVKRDAVNPHFRSNYATLAAIIGAVKPHLSENGLAFTQSIEQSDEGIVVVTQLTHKSGQWMRGQACVPVDKNTAQGVGSATTYGRRYSLAAILGVADSDDDGNDATDNPPTTKRKPRGSKGLKGTIGKKTTPAKPANQTPAGNLVAVGKGSPPESAAATEGDIWIDCAEVPARVLRYDGNGSFDDLQESDPPFATAHETLAKMLAVQAKEDNISNRYLFGMLQEADGADAPASRFSQVSVGALARVLTEQKECPL